MSAVATEITEAQTEDTEKTIPTVLRRERFPAAGSIRVVAKKRGFCGIVRWDLWGIDPSRMTRMERMLGVIVAPRAMAAR